MLPNIHGVMYQYGFFFFFLVVSIIKCDTSHTRTNTHTQILRMDRAFDFLPVSIMFLYRFFYNLLYPQISIHTHTHTYFIDSVSLSTSPIDYLCQRHNDRRADIASLMIITWVVALCGLDRPWIPGLLDRSTGNKNCERLISSISSTAVAKRGKTKQLIRKQSIHVYLFIHKYVYIAQCSTVFIDYIVCLPCIYVL